MFLIIVKDYKSQLSLMNMRLHIRGDRPFSLTNKFNLFDVIGWGAGLCLLSFFTVGVANHVVQNARYFQMQDRYGIHDVDDSVARKVYDFFNKDLKGKLETDNENNMESWRFIPDRLRILYGNDFGRVREC